MVIKFQKRHQVQVEYGDIENELDGTQEVSLNEIHQQIVIGSDEQEKLSLKRRCGVKVILWNISIK